MKTLREQALEWWDNLPFNSSNDVSKQYYYNKHFTNRFTMARNYSELTGREIESIWRKESNN